MIERERDAVSDDNFFIYCAKHYDNPQCLSDDEFYDDLMRIKYIKKLCTRYVENGELKERLILNHLIILANCFKPDVLCKIVWLKMPDHLSYIKPFLIKINVLSDKLINGTNVIDTTLVPMDQRIIDVLRKI